MIHAVICDDEEYMRKELFKKIRSYWNERGLSHTLTTFSSGQALLQSQENFDLVILDIQMEGLTGMETAKLLRRRGFSGPLLFVTVLKENVFDAFEVEALDYLLKPLDEGKLRCALDRALKHLLGQEETRLTIQRGNEYRFIPFGDIVYCEVVNRKVYVHTSTHEVVDYYFKIEDLERELDSGFFRCHRSYLVNLRYVRGYKDGLTTLVNGEKVPVSRLRGQAFAQAVLTYLTKKRH